MWKHQPRASSRRENVSWAALEEPQSPPRRPSPKSCSFLRERRSSLSFNWLRQTNAENNNGFYPQIQGFAVNFTPTNSSQNLKKGEAGDWDGLGNLRAPKRNRSKFLSDFCPCQKHWHPSIYVPINLCIYIYIYSAIYLSIDLSIYLSIYLCAYLLVWLSGYPAEQHEQYSETGSLVICCGSSF